MEREREREKVLGALEKMIKVETAGLDCFNVEMMKCGGVSVVD